ncbi:3553_t:CDS:2, partial [Ambispora gerdemannii]
TAKKLKKHALYFGSGRLPNVQEKHASRVSKTTVNTGSKEPMLRIVLTSLRNFITKDPLALALGVVIGFLVRRIENNVTVLSSDQLDKEKQIWTLHGRLNQAFLDGRHDRRRVEELRTLLSSTEQKLEITRTERDELKVKLTEFQAQATEAMNYLLERKMSEEARRQNLKFEEETAKKECMDSESQGGSRSSTPLSSEFLEADEKMRQLAEDEFFSDNSHHQTINRRESVIDGQSNASTILRTI